MCLVFCAWCFRGPFAAQFCSGRHIPAATLRTWRVCCSQENPKDIQICKLTIYHVIARDDIFLGGKNHFFDTYVIFIHCCILGDTREAAV